jgi:hypothetical protein
MADEGLSGEMGAKKFHGCVEATNVRSVISTLKSHPNPKSPISSISSIKKLKCILRDLQ